MADSDFYDLPMLVGEQYMLTSIVRETRDTILYRATQKELRRDVIVECLRHSAMDNQRKVRMFIDSAKAQASVQGEALTCVLEVFETEGTWLVVKENPAGETLDQFLSDGKRLPALDLCQLMTALCEICLRFDTENLASARFHPEDVYYNHRRFRLNNPVRSGTRSPGASKAYLAEAARDILPLLDSKSRLAGTLASLLRRVSMNQDDSPMKPALFMAEFSSLYTLMLQPPKEESEKAAG